MKGKKTTLEKLAQRIRTWFETHPNESFNYIELSKALDIYGRAYRNDVYEMLVNFAMQGFLKEGTPGRYKLAVRTPREELEGVFMRRNNGMHEVKVEGFDNNFIVIDGNDLRALSGDRVRIIRIPSRVRRLRDREARVTEIKVREKHTFVGVVQKQGNHTFVIPSNNSFDRDFIIPSLAARKVNDGDKVVIAFHEWPKFSANPLAKIVDLLGQSGENNTEMHAILAEFGLPYKYPEHIVKLADKIADGCTPQEISRRVDMRDVSTFTIDPHDAKDFDDALSIRKLPNGRKEVGVHIADVTHYVRPDSPIDKEAFARATSVYLVDRTIPMLPERLCNELCSLRQGEDKLTFSVILEMDDEANILDSRICRTVIRSDRRFTYEEAQEIIETGKGDFVPEILALDRLAKQLRARRYAEGAIAFDRVEVKFNLDAEGKPLGVYFKESKDAHKLIEEFMLVANRTVAEAIGCVEKGKKPKTFVYRVHEEPQEEKLLSLASAASRFGYKLKAQGNNREISKGINRLMKAIKERPEENLLSTLAIRSMTKAIYTTQNVGHYGLAFDHYTHFTSPIRRYPDCLVHRLLERYIINEGRSVPGPQYEELCQHCSEREQISTNAERASIRYKQAEYLSAHLGQTFVGIISGVADFGFFVELKDNLCEGLVSMRELRGDRFIYDERNFCLIGRNSHKRFTLGDEVKVQVAAVNMERKTVDFALVD